MRAHRGPDQRVVAEPVVERPQVELDAERRPHPLDPPLRRGAVGGARPEQDPVGRRLRDPHQHRLAARVHEPVQDAPADPREAVDPGAQRQRENPSWPDFDANLEHWTGYCQPMRTSIDVFAKAREHERLEQLKLARELDALPYFRVLEGPTLPVVEMEGKRRIMLGSNNYLGLTGDERVKQGALDALNQYGTGLTGSRFLNGTIDAAHRARARAGRVA